MGIYWGAGGYVPFAIPTYKVQPSEWIYNGNLGDGSGNYNVNTYGNLNVTGTYTTSITYQPNYFVANYTSTTPPGTLVIYPTNAALKEYRYMGITVEGQNHIQSISLDYGDYRRVVNLDENNSFIWDMQSDGVSGLFVPKIICTPVSSTGGYLGIKEWFFSD